MKGRDVPKAILVHWYQCGRKRRMADADSAVAAASANPEIDRVAYQCTFGDDGHWHIGRPGREMPDRPKWRPHDERRRKARNMQRCWDRYAYRVVLDRGDA